MKRGGGMPKYNKEKSEIAYNLYLKGYKMSEISKKIEVPYGTIRRWKSTHDWDHKKVTKCSPEMNHCSQKEESIEIYSELKNEKWEKFCQYYVKSFNATKAYQKAYDCNYETAQRCGSRLLRNVEIQKRIKELKTGKLAKELMDPDDIVEMMINIAFNDVTDYLEFGRKEIEGEDGETFEVNDMRFKESTDVDGRLIAGVAFGKNGSEIKFCDRIKALEWLAKHFGDNSEYSSKLDEVLAKIEGNI